MIKLRIHELLEQRDMSMAKLSRISDVNYDTVKRLVKNQFNDVGLITLEKIANALQVRVRDLLVEDYPQNPE